MPKFKLSKSDEKWLRNEAKKLPPDHSTTKELTAISGEKLALSGIKKVTNTDAPIDRKALYAIKVENRTNMNHFRRMKKAYEEQGWPGVNIYLDKYRVEEDKIFKTEPMEVKPARKKGILQKIRDKFLG